MTSTDSKNGPSNEGAKLQPPLLDWRAPWHWSEPAAACRHCFEPTPLRDEKGHVHKVCAERQLAQTIAYHRRNRA